MKNKQIYILLLIFIVIILFTSFYFINYIRDNQANNTGIDYVRAKVLEVIDSRLVEEKDILGAYVGSQELKIEILSGRFKGQKLIMTNFRLHGDLVYDVVAEEGMEIVVVIEEKEGKLHSVGVDSYARDKVLYLLFYLFLY